MVYRGLSLEEIKQKASSSFDTIEQRKKDNAKSFAAQQTARNAVNTNMMRLRALREAKEAADAEIAAEQKALAAAAKPKPKPRAAAKTAKAPKIAAE
ncbi:transcriptional regulator [Phreatobacter aquaticus]|uniref:Transcriptional regulator n=1 Tax=Phreatobacter aquaticus TaxID=2570229 RepID=A0A4D7QK32_9HYPH|nr:transcriptional regulator [Phreatobacter aquaticus]QCK85666.1 transcriptional regulator [Phreatobacter aquaticus]